MRFLIEMQDLRAATWVWSLMLFALLIGLLVMMTLQTIKDLLPWRTWFQSGWMRRWLGKGRKRFEKLRALQAASPQLFRPPQPPSFPQQPPPSPSASYPQQPPVNPFVANEGWVDPFEAFDRNCSARTRRNIVLDEEPGIDYLSPERRVIQRAAQKESDWDAVEIALQDLADLATAGSKKALLGLPIEQLCGQMNSAMQLALEHPENHVALIVCVSHLTDPTDLGFLLQPLTELTKESEDAREKQIQKLKVGVYSAARQRLAHHIQRAVDGFQIFIANRWKFVLQLSSIGLGILAVFGVLYFEPGVRIRGNVPDTIFTCVVVGTVSGFTASVMRDVFGLLETAKK
jgi:hypothetical protein